MRFQITADDIGAVISIDKAVEELVKRGSINSISIFPNGEMDLSWITKLDPMIKTGLHLSFSFGQPISSLFSDCLVNKSGYFLQPTKPNLANDKNISKSLESFVDNLNNCPRSELLKECIAQYNAFTKKLDKEPDFINVHHDLDKNPTLRQVLFYLFPEKQTREIKKEKNKEYQYLYQFLDPRDSYSTSFERVYNLLQTCINTINSNPNSKFEVVFHPGYFSKQLCKFSTYTKMREREYKILSSDRITKLVSGVLSE